MAKSMATDYIGVLSGVVVGVVVGLTLRYLEEVLFGAKLKIDCKHPGNTDENANDFYIRFCVQNSARRRVARNCRAYLVGIYKASKRKVISDNLIADTFQLHWAGWDFGPRDIPAKVQQYVDLVRFSKQQEKPGWQFDTRPPFSSKFSSSRLATVPKHIGTYCFKVVVAGDGATPKTEKIYVEYDGVDWKSARPL
jgi:hypothetical protein